MELHQLEYFRALAQIKHFTHAAQSVSISQPALSRAIAKLEDELGTPLFDRSGKELKLTTAGERFLVHVERALREIEMAEREIVDAQKPGYGTVNLSFAHSLGGYYLPVLLSEFHARYPHIQFKLNQHNSVALAKQIASGKTELCLCPTLMTTAHIAWTYLWSEELFVAVPEDHPLANRTSVTLKDVESEPFITLKPAYSLRMLSDQFFEMAESHPDIIFEGDDINTLASLVAAKLGVSLLPHIPGIGIGEGVVFLPVAFPLCKRTVGIAWNANHQLSPAAITFQQFVIHRFAETEKVSMD
jgi:DNA-binding transcriptional LysR family regulator